VSNNAYLPIEFEPLYVSESSACKEYAAVQDLPEWTDEEISAIRVVLQKLSTIRIMNSNDAEDLVQETLLTLIARCPKASLEKGPLVWSMGIFRKKVGNYYRKVQRYAALSDKENDLQQYTSPICAVSSPEVNIFHTELQGLVDETLSQLPPAQRQAMELLIEGLDPGEIVNQLHPEHYQNVINRLHRGRKKLAQELAKYGYGPEAKTGLRKMKRCRIKK
jgi:RNA polymerase sigma factor (sigma-70 family)